MCFILVSFLCLIFTYILLQLLTKSIIKLSASEADQLCMDCGTFSNRVCFAKRLGSNLGSIDVSSSYHETSDFVMDFLDPLRSDEAFNAFLNVMNKTNPRLTKQEISSGRNLISNCHALLLSSKLAQRLMDRTNAHLPGLTYRKTLEEIIRTALVGIDNELVNINFRPLLENGALNWSSRMFKNLAILHNLNNRRLFILPQLPHVDTHQDQSFFALNLSQKKIPSTLFFDYTSALLDKLHPLSDMSKLSHFEYQSVECKSVYEFNMVST